LAAVGIASSARGNFGSSRRLKLSALPTMNINRLKSCAMASGQFADRLHFLRHRQLFARLDSFSSTSRRSVPSRMILAKPISLPSS
jgi:hypothetical protein